MNKCPKCGHERTDNDDPLIPGTICPSCHIVFSKYGRTPDKIFKPTLLKLTKKDYFDHKNITFLQAALIISASILLAIGISNISETLSKNKALQKEAENKRSEAEKKHLATLQNQQAQQQARQQQFKNAEAASALQRKQQKEAECKQDARCVSREIIDTMAIVNCQRKIEALAKYQFKWTDGIFESKLRNFVWKDAQHTSIIGFGHTIEFQNAFGAWQPYLYTCEIRVSDSTVITVQASPGRPQPN